MVGLRLICVNKKGALQTYIQMYGSDLNIMIWYQNNRPNNGPQPKCLIQCIFQNSPIYDKYP